MKMRLVITLVVAFFCLVFYGEAGSQDDAGSPGAPPDSLPPGIPVGPQAPGEAAVPDSSGGPDTSSTGIPAEQPSVPDSASAPLRGPAIQLPDISRPTGSDTVGARGDSTAGAREPEASDTSRYGAATDILEEVADTLHADTVAVPVDTITIGGLRIPLIPTGLADTSRATGPGEPPEDAGPAYWTARARLEPETPKFARTSQLDMDFSEAFEDRWRKAGTSRTYEVQHASLSDYSNIDIPIKFPDTIGRVIGQGANLNVSGSERITFGGTSTYQVNEKKTEFGRRSRFPTLDMKQQLKIDLNGTVGEKIHVTVHHDSEIETPLENRIKLRYEGDDDEIVQSIEMGNTNLTLPGSRFVSYSGQQQGLFGAKMLAKLGGLDLSLIASKQEGRTAGASFKGTAKKDSVTISDMNYIRNKYFFMIDPYERIQGREFTQVKVFVDDGDGSNNKDTGAVPAWAFLDPNTPGDSADWDSLAYSGDFDVLTVNEDYAVDLQTGEIALLRPLGDAHALAVTYAYGGVQVGVPEGADIRLKMIRPPSNYMIEREDVWKAPTLKLMRKNVYSLGARYISEEQVEVRIFRRASPVDEELQGDLAYAKILGIDLQDENGSPAEPPDWQTDTYADGGTINGELGLLIFPALRPFDPRFTIKEGLPPLEDTNPIIYDEHINSLREADNSKYYITVRYSTPETSFKLKHINILEGSEVVTLNGTRLTRNVDYEIYYDIGQIRFKTEEAALPNAEISVDYQYVPFLSLAQQSLVGAQGIYRLSDQSHIGSLWLFQGKKSPEERPRLGQEPSQIVMGDLNANFQFAPSFMTTLINALPFVDSDKPSRLTLAGELGMSIPNPNTKGQVYIDDMEGVQDLRSFSVMREAWVPSSPPTDYRWQDARRLNWYVKDREVKEEDLFPKAESRPGESYIPVLEIKYRGPTYPNQGFDTFHEWAGLMRLISKTGADYSELRFFEVWLRQKQGEGGRLNVDLGAVSENYYNPWSDTLHTEDKDQDGELNQDQENTGLDGVFTGQPGDDPLDDWDYSEGQYSKINGTEGNPRTVPDTEDLDDDGNLDTDDVHFRLSFDLSDTTYIANTSGEWTLYRFPLLEAANLGGSPSWRSIRYIRFFFTEADTQSVFQVAYMQIAGTSWLEEGIRVKEEMTIPEIPGDEVFEISAKNTRDDPDYDPPYDPGKDPQGYRKREQSMVMSIRNLQPGHSGSVYKVLSGEASDYTLYQALAFYVHGDEQAGAEDIHIFVRFGSDSLNFYEYATPVKSGWESISIPLGEITNLKTADPDSVMIYGVQKKIPFRYADREDGWIAVYGSPSITRISRVGVGIVNSGDVASSSAGTEVWFDDLRLTDVRKEAGFAGRFSVGASFSDVATINLDYERTDTEFQTLSSSRSGSDDTRYSISGSSWLEKLLPISGFSLPISFRYHKSISLPTLKSQSDIVLMPDQRTQEQKSSVDDSYKIGFSKTGKSKNPLLRLTLDAISTSVSYSRRRGVSPELADTSSGYSGSLNYKVSPWWRKSVRVFRGYSLGFMPDNVSLTVSGSTKSVKTINKRLNVVKQDRYSRDIKGDYALTYTPISGPSLKTDYSFSMTRDMDTNKRVPIVESIGFGTELKRSQRAGIRITPAFGRVMKPTLSYDVNYGENSDPSVRSSGDPAGIRRASVSAKSVIDVVIMPSSSVSMPAPADTVGMPIHKLLLSKIPDITMSYVIDRSGSYQKLLERPGLAFQFGLDTKVDEEIVFLGQTGAAQRTDEHKRTQGFLVSSDFSPIKQISLEGRYKRDKSKREYSGGTSFKTTQSWPDISGNITGLASLGFLGSKLKGTSLSFGYRRAQTEEGSNAEVNKETVSSEWLPLVGWDATWSNGLRTTFNLRHSRGETETFTGAGTRKTTSGTYISFSLSHSLSAPQGMYIPLAGRTLKFESNLTLGLDVSYDMDLAKTPTAGDRVDTDTRKLSIGPHASYSFSKNITGSANARYEQRTDRKLSQTWRTIGLNASVLIRF